MIYVLLYGVAVLSPNVCLTLASGSRFRGSSMNYKWQNNKKAFVLSVWRSKVGGKSKMCSRYWQNAVRCTTALMLCGLKKANNSLLLYYYILLQVLQQGHSRISNELRITALRLVNQVFFQEYESRSKVSSNIWIFAPKSTNIISRCSSLCSPVCKMRLFVWFSNTVKF